MTAHDTMHQPLQHIVFDMGGVLMTFDAMFFAQQYTTCDEDAQLLARAYFLRTEWALLDSGTITPETMVRVAEASLPARLHPALHACAAGWQHHSQPIAAVNELAARLKQRGLNLYLLSNASVEVDRQLEHCPAYPLMSGRVISGFERLMKPDPAIYQLLCTRYGLDPATCLFVDDNANNCTGAQVAGMMAYRFDGDAAALERAIERLL